MITERKEWQFFAVLPKADALLATVWWAALILRGVLPAVFALVMGALVDAVQNGTALASPQSYVVFTFDDWMQPSWWRARRPGCTTA